MTNPSTGYASRYSGLSRMNQQSIEITRMIINDVDEIVSIENSTFPVPWSRDVFLRELQIPESRNLVAKAHKNQSKEIAGYVIYWVIAGEVQIHKIAVRENSRKSGIASRIMAEVLRCSREEGALSCTLEVGQSNENAKKLYEKFGFTVIEVRKKYYHESGDDALVMCLDLKP
ncbi:MAG TPA: ribosomal-protein-alanine N-acetyltransferase [Syntrophaceae bacterium]|jgi:ribosomal-protein-alanine N-acetyltransferase|nr:ribosomal-protein-alanine N-acetyltransferase [Syntrophaceae bacterium]